MTIAHIQKRSSVQRAIKEFDKLGRKAFLSQYGFGGAKQFFLVYDGKRYDAKAILGVAYHFEFPNLQPLKSKEFTGGQDVEQKLRHLKFQVVVLGRDEAAMLRPVVDGKELDANFSVHDDDGNISVLFRSGGGSQRANTARNVDYHDGLESALERLRNRGACITDLVAELKSRSKEERSLKLGGNRTYPINLRREHSMRKLRLAISTARTPRAKTRRSSARRLRMMLSFPPDATPSAKELATYLVQGSGDPYVVLCQQVEEQAKISEDSKPFNPSSIEDGRSWIVRQIAQRWGQSKFRKNLLKAYDERCAITGCDVTDALEAAHIFPYKGDKTNHVTNGLLLRADIHTLFDLGLIAVETENFTVVVNHRLRASSYGELEGVKLRTTTKTRYKPNKEALDRHRSIAQL